MRKHKTRKISYDNLEADVDCGIADLVLALWKMGFVTLFSCEGRRSPGKLGNQAHYAYIKFDSWPTVLRFINLLFEAEVPIFEVDSENDCVYFNKRYLKPLTVETMETAQLWR